MYHTVEFITDTVIDIALSCNGRLVLLVMEKGKRCKAQVRPYVVETPEGPTEVADLLFEDGTSTKQVGFECFSFVDAEACS
jgi:hypothetical protein